MIHAGRGKAAGGRSPLAVAAELEAAGVRPRKSRGQNFLIQPAIADRIVAAAAIALGDEVVEIGPGLGILSDRILRAGVRRLWLVELNGFSCSWLYQCDLAAVVAEASKLAREIWARRP